MFTNKRLLLNIFVFCILFIGVVSVFGVLGSADSDVYKTYTDGIGTGAIAELKNDGTLVIKLADGYTEAELKDYKSSSSSLSSRPFASDLGLVKAIYIEDGITYIGNYFFKGVGALTEIVIPGSVTEIGTAAFGGVETERVSFTGTMSEWCKIDVSATTSLPLAGADLYIDGVLAEHVVIPEDVDVIKQYAFYGSDTVKSLVLHGGVSEIEKGAFNKCGALTDVKMPADTVIGTSGIVVSEGMKVTLTVCGTVSSPVEISATKLAYMKKANVYLSCGKVSFALDDAVCDEIISHYDIADYAYLGVDVTVSGNITVYTTEFKYSDGSDVLKSGATLYYEYDRGIGADELSMEYDKSESGISYDSESGIITVAAESFGVLTVIRADVPMPSFIGAYLNLNENINLVYRVSIPDIYTSYRVDVDFCGASYTLSPVLIGEGVYDFRFNGIMPYQMNDAIDATVTVYDDAGNARSITYKNMSVRRYYELVVSYYPSDTKLLTLVSDLLYYGECAQIYRNYKTDALVTEGLLLTRSKYTSPDDLLSLSGDNENVMWNGAGLYCADNMGMYFKAVSNRTDVLVRITHNSKTLTYSLADITPDGDGRYEIRYTGIQAYEFDDVVTAELVDGVSGDIVSVLTYSVGSYVKSAESSTDTGLLNLVKAIRCYGSSAKAYR